MQASSNAHGSTLTAFSINTALSATTTLKDDAWGLAKSNVDGDDITGAHS